MTVSEGFGEARSRIYLPVFLVGLLVVAIFFVEVGVMWLVPRLPASWPYWVASILDAVILVFLLLPAFYFLVSRPLLRALKEREKSNQRLLEAHADLESRVTERTAALRASEERYRALFENNPASMWVYDEETLAFLAVNQSACRQYGYSHEEFLDMTIRDIRPGGDVPALLEHIAGESGSHQEAGVWRHRRKDGTIFEVEITSDRVIFGEREATLVLAKDLTKRRRAEESVQKLLFAVEQAENVIFMTDPDGAITYVNPAFETVYGFSREEALGKTPRILKSGQYDRSFYKRFWQKLLAGESVHGEIVNKRHDGQLVTVEERVNPFLNAEGRRIGFIAVQDDVTQSRLLEEQFRQSQKMEAVGRLAGGVAHDFNNLLTVILGYSDVLLQGLEPGPLREAAQEVRGAGKRAAALTRQLLAFSRKQALVPEVLDLGDVVSGLSSMVERLIGEEVKVSVVVSPGLGRVKADRGQLEQVVMNLAVNARDAMPKGGSLIFELQNVELDDAYTATHAEVKPGPYVLLAISDTGTGMDAETQKRIFEPFFTTKEAGKGTGLGLSTVYGIVHQSGGSIDVYSESGRGTTFKVYLPRFAGDAAVPRADSGLHPTLATESETVLVVEDEAAIRQLTKLILQKAGYTVLLAESPVAAERIAGSHPGPIHLLLTDVVMPGMRGPELAERLLRARPDLRVLYMSGYTDNAIAHHGFLDAGTELLQKPFTPNGLMKKIREVLGRSEP
jgi:PAS domain S-box-containing protein